MTRNPFRWDYWREDVIDLFRFYQRGVLWYVRASGLEPHLVRLLDWLNRKVTR